MWGPRLGLGRWFFAGFLQYQKGFIKGLLIFLESGKRPATQLYPHHMMHPCKNRYSKVHLSANKDMMPLKKKELPKKETGKVALQEALELEGSGNK